MSADSAGSLPRRGNGYRLGLIAILLASFALRLVLVDRGGQYFWNDERGRYGAAVAAWDYWDAGRTKDGIVEIMGSAEHLGFKILMLGPAWVQRRTHGDLRVPSVFVSLFSVANILWVWLIARRTGGDEREAFWSAAAMASANSMFYWARHLMPYDIALFWALACAYVAWRPAVRNVDSLLAGVLGFAAFVTYNGYWALVACVLTLHVLRGWPSGWKMILRAGFGLVGLVGSFVLLLSAVLPLEIYLLASYQDFLGTIVQGDFREGHVVFFDYLWQTERFTALIWLGAVLAFFPFCRRSSAEERRRGAWWFAMIAALTAIPILGSNVFEQFVVYGRVVRQVVPFCALLVGWTAARMFGPAAPWRSAERAALAALFACGAWSMAPPLRQEFPDSFSRRALRVMENYRRSHVSAGGAMIAPEKFRVLYGAFIWPAPEVPALPPHYEVLLASPHPLAWRPYLYEGFKRSQRDQFQATDITMRLVLLKD